MAQQSKYKGMDRVTDRNGNVWLFNGLFGTFSNVMQTGKDFPGVTEYYSPEALHRKYGPLIRVPKITEQPASTLRSVLNSWLAEHKTWASTEAGKALIELLRRDEAKFVEEVVSPAFNSTLDALNPPYTGTFKTKLKEHRTGPRTRRVKDSVSHEYRRNSSVGRRSTDVYVENDLGYYVS